MTLRIRNKEDLKNVGFHPRGGLDLRGADLEEANLRGVNFRGANFVGACLAGADLEGANLVRASLTGANLRGANLRGAHLNVAHLMGAHFEEADLREADLYRANFRGAVLCRADLRGADLFRADLRGARFGGAFLNWLSQPLLLAVLAEAAFRDEEKIAVANFTQNRTSLCWKDFIVEGSLGEFEHLKPWVVSVLDQYDGFIDQMFSAYTGS